MSRILTYSIAASVGLAISCALAWPALKGIQVPAPGQPAAPDPGNPVQAVQGAPAPAENQTLVSCDLSSGCAVLTLNGQPVGQFQSATQSDVSRFVHPGANALRVMWLGPVGGDIRVTHSTAPGQYREVGSCFLAPASTQTAGEQTVTFYL